MPVGVRVDGFWPHSSGVQGPELRLVNLGCHSPPCLHLCGRNIHLGGDTGPGIGEHLGTW